MGLLSRNVFGRLGFRHTISVFAACLAVSVVCHAAVGETVTMPWEKLDPIEVDGTIQFREIGGEPFRANFVGGPADDILWVERRKIEEEKKSEGEGEGDAEGAGEEEDRYTLVFTLVDVEAGAAWTARRELGVYPWVVRLLDAGGQPRLATFAGRLFWLFRIGPDDLRFTSSVLPENAQALDFGHIGPGPELHAVALTHSTIHCCRVTDAPLEWAEYEGTPTLYAPLTDISAGSRRSSLYGGARFVRDLDGDGRDEILLPSDRTLTIGVRGEEGGIGLQTLDLPEGSSDVTRYEGYCDALRQPERIRGHGRLIRMGNLVYRPGLNPYHPKGMCLALPSPKSNPPCYALHKTGGQFSLEPMPTPDIRVRGDVVPGEEASDLSWAPVTYRLLRPRSVFGVSSNPGSDEHAWLVDINGDGRDEVLHWRGTLATTGPKVDLQFTLAGTQEEKGLIAHCWAYLGDGGLADLNGDGALDLVTFRPALDIRRVLQGMHMKGKVDLVYTIWFFDKSRGEYNQRNTLDLKLRQVYDPTDGRQQVIGGDREWSWWRVDYGDLNGDGLLDLAFILSETEVGIVLNEPEAGKRFDKGRMMTVQVPEYSGLLACDLHGTQTLISWKGFPWRTDNPARHTVVIPKGPAP